MIELSRHIEILLMENDCVIVPGLGGFITYYQPAHYEEAEELFLPPSRTVGFNPQLTMNDGLLAQSYMQVYHTDYSDALRRIRKEVELLKEMLQREGTVELLGIGSLHCTLHNTYEFHPNENGLPAPALYALDAFTIAPLPLEVAERIEPVSTVVQPSGEKDKTVRMTSRWWGNAVAVAVAAILFFILSVPVENTYVEKGNYASLGTDGLFDAIRTQSVTTVLMTSEAGKQNKQVHRRTAVTPVSVKTEKVAPAVQESDKAEKAVSAISKKAVKAEKAPKKEQPKKEVAKETRKSADVQPGKKKYHLIVASLTTDQDAQGMLQTYRNQGYADAKVLGGNGRFRIALCSYATSEDAYRKLNELKQQDAFKNAWMLTSK